MPGALITRQLGKIIKQKTYFIIKLNISQNLLNTVLKVKKEWLSGYRMDVSVSVVYSDDLMADWELPLPSITREDCTTHQRPRKRSKFKIQSPISIECTLPWHHLKSGKLQAETLSGHVCT